MTTLINFLDICKEPGIIKVLLYIKRFINFVLVVIHIGLILIITIDLFKNIMSPKDDNDKKNTSKAIKRIIYCIILFLVPNIINLTIDLTETIGINIPYTACWSNASPSKLKKLEIEQAKKLVNKAETSLNDDNLLKAQNAVKQITDDEQRKMYEKRLEEVSKKIEVQKLKEKAEKEAEKKRVVRFLKTMDIASSKNLVGIFYTTWHHPNNGTAKIITEQSNFCERGVNYYWGKPALGYYSSDDKNVIKTHMKQLAEAKVDFIIIDYTNMNPNAGFSHGSSGWNRYVDSPLKAILETISEMRNSGAKTPYVLLWVWTGNSGGYNQFEGWNSINAIYDDFYKNTKYSDIWVYWGGKPFFITTSPTPEKKERDIVTRSMWGLNGIDRYDWTYLEVNNDKPAKDKNGNVEQIGVSTAMQQSYMSDSSAICRRNGETFYNQWKTAFKYHPKVVTITWWNEWTAGCLNGGTFTDEYSQECSRDIEPMSGGHGSRYYEMMKEYISAYKSNKSCPHLTER